MLTPVEQHNGVYYKRDDLYCPWGDVNGGKVRQAEALFETEEIQDSPGVIAAVSVHSPTGPVISRVAQEFGKWCIIGVGGTKPERFEKLPMMKLTKHYEADIMIVAGHGMKNAITARVNDIAKETGYHNIDYSKHIYQNRDLMFDTNAAQVENIPEELDVLVMSLGVGIQFSCVLKGLKKFGKKVKRIIGVQVGPDRRKLIDGYLNQNPLTEPRFDLEYDLVQYKTPYSKPEVQRVGDFSLRGRSFYLDDIYEAKAHKWMLENINKDQKILFWCVGRRLTSDQVESICKR